ncbi:STAS/SEC14 domain-containing protein [Actinoplanes sp. NPDC026623]|uniref:STAS/SEC14 domain-containing protein n=1 Tax=Actinoplanes sp. NPDC026623 TaxID=3155610 RepID=UPI0033CC1A43
MIELLTDLPDGTLGFRLSGPVSRDEYVKILLPPMKAAIEGGRGVRLLLVVGDDFGWFEPGAFWEDLKFGLGPGIAHHKAWERTAIVSDADWVRHAMGVFGWLMPGQARAFTQAGMDQARTWIAEDL